MLKIRVCEDQDECKKLWTSLRPHTEFFDLWQVRSVFAESFTRQPYFIVAEQAGKAVGLLPLAYAEELGHYVYYPGELWQGKTWLEQNKITAPTPEVATELLRAVPGPARIRYLSADFAPWGAVPVDLDEIGYLFLPAEYHYDFQAYLQKYSGKSRKKILKEIDLLSRPGVSFRYDRAADVETMFRLNLTAFADYSYFHDQRFLRGFEQLVALLAERNWLRITTVLIGGEVAAVDLGAVLGGHYTVLAGGTNGDFPGVAKLINFHHLEWSCAQRLTTVDFLCGDFGWKSRFQLTPRPLYEIKLDGRLATATVNETAGSPENV